MESDNTIKQEFDNSILNLSLDTKLLTHQRDLIDFLFKEISKRDDVISEQKFRLDNIQHFLTSKISSKRYGEIKDNENE